MNGDNYNRRRGQLKRYGNNLGLENAAHDHANPDTDLASVSREGLAAAKPSGRPKTLGEAAVKGVGALAKKIGRKL